MNRRHFIGNFASALAGFAILPAATTYTRLWKAVRVTGPMLNPAWETAEFQAVFICHPSHTLGVPMKLAIYADGTKALHAF